MNRLLILPVLLLTLLVGNSAFSADFQKGLDAAQSGDFATALREWTPFVDRGFAMASTIRDRWNAKGQEVQRAIRPRGRGNRAR